MTTPLSTGRLHPARIYDRALALMQQQRVEEAKALLIGLRDSGVRNPPVLLLLGAAHGQLREFAEAESCCRAVLRKEPKNPWANSNLGNALLELGRTEEAERFLRTAVRLDPNLIEAQSNLSNALKMLGRYDEAREILQRALKLDPRFVAAHVNLAALFLHEGKPAEAAAHANKAIELDPRSADGWYNLGAAYSILGKHKKAISFLHKSLELKPDNPRALNSLGNQYFESGLFEDAEQCFARLRAIDPDSTDVIAAEASILEKKGEVDEAWRRIAPLIDAGVDNPHAYNVFARICGELRDPDLQRRALGLLEGTLERHRTMAASARMQVHFMLGKLYDQLGEPEPAFRHYLKANALKPVYWSAQNNHKFFDELIEAWNPERYARLPRAGNESPLPVFILGMPRSGTTLVEQILDSHPLVHGAGELPDIGDMIKGLSGTLGSPVRYPGCLDALTGDVLDRLAETYLYSQRSRDPQALRVTDKMPHNFLYIGFITLLLPRARIIHCQRDPLDTCLSCYFQNFNSGHGYSFDLANLGHYYRDYRRIMHHWTSTLGIEMLDVRYEDMVSDLEGNSRRILEFIGLDWDDRCLEFHTNARHVQTASYQQVRQPLYTKSKGRNEKYRPFLDPLIEALGPDIVQERG